MSQIYLLFLIVNIIKPTMLQMKTRHEKTEKWYHRTIIRISQKEHVGIDKVLERNRNKIDTNI